ncbi:MAG: GNAT family N-acetyltransferase [Bacillaceae bacterium]|nr:GNAT family N-acetyltransferase [Bacillaceae bacterium]
MSAITFDQVKVHEQYIVEEITEEKLKLSDKNVNLFIKLDDTYVGLISYFILSGTVFIDQFQIHRDYRGYGFGTQAYFELETMLIKQGFKSFVVYSSLQENKFFETKGYTLKQCQLERYIFEKKII